jgi:hypothetical protein
MLLRGRPLLRVAVALVVLSLGAMLFTWIVVPDEQQCRWGISIWDGERAREGFVRVPCSLSEAQVRQYLDEHPHKLPVVTGSDWEQRQQTP